MLQMRESCQFEQLEQIAQRIRDVWPAEKWIETDTIVAVSGGSDSVGLLRAMHYIKNESGGGGKLHVVHCNHQTREHAEKDAEFVCELSDSLDVCCSCVHINTYENERGVGLSNSEESLRNQRYATFFQAAEQNGARYIVTGHTCDDQIETILFRICRGTGLSGLQGIPAVRVHERISIVRPLLNTRRREIVDMLREIQQPFRTDVSNLSSNYSRNFLRNEIIPKLTARFGQQFENSILRLIEQSTENENLLDSLTNPVLEMAGVETNLISLPAPQDLEPLLIRHALKRLWRTAGFPEQMMTRANWMRLADLISESDGTIQLPGNITATFTGGILRISR